MQTIIFEDEAISLAQTILKDARRLYLSGSLNKFARGQMQGQMTIVSIYMGAPRWIVCGIENEIDFLCKRAVNADQ